MAIIVVTSLLIACTVNKNVDSSPNPSSMFPEDQTPLTTKPVDDYTPNNDQKDFEPGVIILKLKEKCNGTLEIMFPEIDIEFAENHEQRFYDIIKDSPDIKERAANVKECIGTNYYIILKEKTKEATIAGVEILSGNPAVEYATYNYIYEPAE